MPTRDCRGTPSRARREGRSIPIERHQSGEPDTDALAVRIALVDLPADERELLVLRYFVGLSDPEVAEVVKRPLGTVKTVIRRGLQHLREALQ